MKQYLRQATQSKEGGFTVVEMIITIVVLAIFLTGVFQSYLLLESQRVEVARQARASDIAYSNLRKFMDRPSNLSCNPGKMDLTANSASSKPGELLGDETNSTSGTASTYGFVAEGGNTTDGMGGNLHQRVTAYAPQGCTGSNFTNGVVKIISTVTYGNGGSVSHASFIQ